MNGGSGDSGDDRAWRAYERPDVPEPESRPDAPQPASDWQVYGDRRDPQEWRATTGQPWSPPIQQWQAPWGAKGVSARWRNLSTGRKIRAVLGGVVLGGWALGALAGGADDSSRTQDVVPAYEYHNSVASLKVENLERLERIMRRELGTTTITSLFLRQGFIAFTAEVGGEDRGYAWRGGPLLDSPLSGGGAEFDLADVDLEAASRAGERAKDRVGRAGDLWWVSVKVPDGASEPLIKAEAVGNRHTVTIELEADGTLISEQVS